MNNNTVTNYHLEIILSDGKPMSINQALIDVQLIAVEGDSVQRLEYSRQAAVTFRMQATKIY
jgi:hypothetical protein